MPTTPRPHRPHRRAASRLGRRLRHATCLAGATLLLLASSLPAHAVAPSVPDTVLITVPGSETPAPQLPDPIEVRPSWHDMPGKDKILSLLDVVSQVGLACCIAAVVIGGGIMGLSKLTGAGRGGTLAAGLVLGGGGGTILIMVAPAAVAWLAG